MAQPQTLGKYSIVATLGRGGMGEVFLARVQGPAGFNKLVVVKAMRDTVAGDERFKKMLLDEARLAARLRHPNVVQTIEVGDVGGRPLIAMEYLEGQPLNTILATLGDRGERLGPALAARIVCEALAGLHYAHELEDFDGKTLGIVHRDISPHNIFVTYDGEVKILDFGIAKATTNANETELGTVKGKVAYMAPEQARGDALDRRGDLFAIGLVLWEMLTAKRMLVGDTTAAILTRLLHDPLPKVADFCPDLDPALEAIVSKSIEKDASARFQTALEMRQALAPFQRDITRDDVGARVGELFDRERRSMQTKIRSAMKAPRVDEGSTKTIRVATGEILGAGDETATVLEGKNGDEVATSTATTKSMVTPPASAAAISDGAQKKRNLRLIGAAAVAVAAAGAWFIFRPDAPKDVTGTTPVTSATPATAAAPEVVLRLQGSDSIGEELAPALVEAFFRHEGATAVSRVPVQGHHLVRLVASFPIAPMSRAIEIDSEGSARGFTALASGECDIAMSSRRPHADEIEKWKSSGLGDPTSRVSEHVVALDGISIIVGSNNPIHVLDRNAISGLFSGKTSDFSAAGGPSGAVDVYVRDEASGTGDALRAFLGLSSFAPSAKSVADNTSLSDAVAADPRGIGFVGMAYVRNAKALAISAPGIAPRTASPLTVATESYLLSRRLYLYTAERPKTQLASELTRFALSADGQQSVRAAGFVGLGVTFEPAPRCGSDCPAEYVSHTKNARRLSLDFRFDDQGTELDNRSTNDVDRLSTFLDETPNTRLLLFGFSDSSAGANATADSNELATSVRTLLTDHGARVTSAIGLGSAMPVLPAGVDGARARNRRVEVWVDDGSSQNTGESATAKPKASDTVSVPKPPAIETTR